MEILQPPGWVWPKGYSNGIAMLAEANARLEIKATAMVPN